MFEILDKSVRNFDAVSYHRGNPIGFPLFYGSGERTDLLNHIYNPSKPPFDKGDLWQGDALLCYAIVYNHNARITCSKSSINRFEISMECTTIEEIQSDFLFFYGSGVGLERLILIPPLVKGETCGKGYRTDGEDKKSHPSKGGSYYPLSID